MKIYNFRPSILDGGDTVAPTWVHLVPLVSLKEKSPQVWQLRPARTVSRKDLVFMPRLD